MASFRKFVGELYLILAILSLILVVIGAKSDEDNVNEKWKKKDVRDYTDADLERLYDQWEEEDDEPLEEDELPEWKRPQEKIDMSKIDPNDPESVVKLTKKGRTLMMFATVSGNPTEKETQTISQLWQSSLFNAQYETQRYVVGENRILFVLKDGSKAWEIKEFLVNQERCEVVTIEGKDYFGKGHTKGKKSGEDNSKETDRNKGKTDKKKKKSAKKPDNKYKDEKSVKDNKANTKQVKVEL